MADLASSAAALREPFPASAIGVLPRAKQKDAPKGHCNECGGYHGLPAVHLDYVGHAAVTDRLLTVDPSWTWEPLALAADGGPLIRQVGSDAELWISLTVCGHTRIGVGTAPSKSFELSKQLVSDAIRNAAMRFGVALDLWAKEDLHEIANPPEPAPVISGADAERIRGLLNAADAETRSAWMAKFGCKPTELPVARLIEADDWLSDLETNEPTRSE